MRTILLLALLVTTLCISAAQSCSCQQQPPQTCCSCNIPGNVSCCDRCRDMWGITPGSCWYYDGCSTGTTCRFVRCVFSNDVSRVGSAYNGTTPLEGMIAEKTDSCGSN